MEIKNIDERIININYDIPIIDLIKEYTNGLWYNDSFDNLTAVDFGNFEKGKQNRLIVCIGMLERNGTKILRFHHSDVNSALKKINARPTVFSEVLHLGITNPSLCYDFLMPAFGSIWCEATSKSQNRNKNIPYLAATERSVCLVAVNNDWDFDNTLIPYVIL